jgi:hypothetical protein
VREEEWFPTGDRASRGECRDESGAESEWHAGFDLYAVRHFHRRVSAARHALVKVLAAPDCRVEPSLVDERVALTPTSWPPDVWPMGRGAGRHALNVRVPVSTRDRIGSTVGEQDGSSGSLPTSLNSVRLA